MVEHHRTDILLKNCCTQSNMVVHTIAHGRTRSHKIYSYSTQPHRRPYTVEHGHTTFILTAHSHTDDHTRSNKVTQTTAHGCRWSHMVAQTTVHGRTRSHKKSSAARMAYPLSHTYTSHTSRRTYLQS